MRRTNSARRRACTYSVPALCLAAAIACDSGDIILGEGGHPRDAAADGGRLDSDGDVAAAAHGRLAAAGDAAISGPQTSTADASDAAVATPNPAVRPSSGCRQAPKLDHSVLVEGERADYTLDLPSDYDSNRVYPLLLAFRGMNVSTEQFRSQLGLPEVLGSAAIVVHANPRNEAVGWDFQRDTLLVDALLAQLASAACIDLDRIFTIGDGAGALFVNLLGCVRGDQVRGIALMSSAPPPPGPCVGSTAVWLWQQTDVERSISGAGLGNRDFWAGRNGCDVRSPTASDGSPCVDYTDCKPGLPLRYCEHTGVAPLNFVARAVWELFRSL